ncbi:hypothetical protein FKM82_009618 [Ascaphus truei]
MHLDLTRSLRERGEGDTCILSMYDHMTPVASLHIVINPLSAQWIHTLKVNAQLDGQVNFSRCWRHVFRHRISVHPHVGSRYAIHLLYV